MIIAAGNISGVADNVLEYFNPDQMNPVVLVFHVSIIVLWALSVWWIYFKNDAEFIEKHPGLIQTSSFSGISGTSNVTAKQFRLFFPLMLLGGIAAVIMMWVMNFPSPQF